MGKEDWRGSAAAPGLSLGTTPVRSHLLKSLRRFARTIRTEWRLFSARPGRVRPWTVPLLLCICTIIFFSLVISISYRMLYYFHFGNDRAFLREAKHFSHNVKAFLPRQSAWDDTKLSPCSWTYIEVNAGDGRFLNQFFLNGNKFLEEFLRATQSSMRGFCALALEPDPQMQPALGRVRQERGRKGRRFDVFAGVAAAVTNGTENIKLRAHYDMNDPQVKKEAAAADADENVSVRSIAFTQLVQRLTRSMESSGQGNDAKGMTVAVANGNNGTSIVRINAANVREALWYLKMLEDSSVMCDRIDRLILNLQPLEFDASSVYLIDRRVSRDWDKLFPADTAGERFDYRKGIDGVLQIANDISTRANCRTIVYVFNEKGKKVHPGILSERNVFYSILAGHPTFDVRISAQTSTWMTAVPMDRIAIYTNVARNSDELVSARGRTTIVTKPYKPDLEKHLHMMQSWSHLVRVRETWDRFMKNDPSIKWLALVDDDTFVFPGGMREYLSNFDHRLHLWGGSGEQARIDNGDEARFAHRLRFLNKRCGGTHCYLENEDIPKRFRGRRIIYGISSVMNGRRVARVVSHMCSDTFCRRGCPAVPQGAAIFLTRALVESLRPHIEQCEEETLKLCKNCGSQRLYMCVNFVLQRSRTLMTRGVCRAPWRLERRESWPFALTYHGFQKYRGLSLSTRSIEGDMKELWQVGKSVEESAKAGYRDSFYVPMQRISDLIGCRGQGTYYKGNCVTKEGVELESHDGNPRKDEIASGHHASERFGSA